MMAPTSGWSRVNRSRFIVQRHLLHVTGDLCLCLARMIAVVPGSTMYRVSLRVAERPTRRQSGVVAVFFPVAVANPVLIHCSFHLTRGGLVRAGWYRRWQTVPSEGGERIRVLRRYGRIHWLCSLQRPMIEIRSVRRYSGRVCVDRVGRIRRISWDAPLCVCIVGSALVPGRLVPVCPPSVHLVHPHTAVVRIVFTPIRRGVADGIVVIRALMVVFWTSIRL